MVITVLSWTPCRRSSPSYVKIFLFFAALNVPTRASNMFAHRSSLNRTPKVTYIYKDHISFQANLNFQKNM